MLVLFGEKCEVIISKFACYFIRLTTWIDQAFSNSLIVMNDKLESLNVQTNVHQGGINSSQRDLKAK